MSLPFDKPPYDRLTESIVRRLAGEIGVAIPQDLMRRVLVEAAMETWVEVRETR